MIILEYMSAYALSEFVESGKFVGLLNQHSHANDCVTAIASAKIVRLPCSLPYGSEASHRLSQFPFLDVRELDRPEHHCNYYSKSPVLGASASLAAPFKLPRTRRRS